MLLIKLHFVSNLCFSQQSLSLGFHSHTKNQRMLHLSGECTLAIDLSCDPEPVTPGLHVYYSRHIFMLQCFSNIIIIIIIIVIILNI